MQTNFYQYDWADAEVYSLSNTPLLDLAVELSNHIAFHIYCRDVQAKQESSFCTRKEFIRWEKSCFPRYRKTICKPSPLLL